MTTSVTPGHAMRAALDRSRGPGMEWDERELATLDLIEVTTGRLAALRTVCDKVIANPKASLGA